MKGMLHSVRNILSRLIFLVGLLCILFAALNAVLACRASAAEKAELREQLELPADQRLEVIELYDDHGGFFGDGQSLSRILPDQGGSTGWMETDTLNTANWNELPISDSAAQRIWLEDDTDVGYLLNWKAGLKEIENGKWLLVNRGESAGDGALLNYTLYLYDSDLGELYCYRFDC